jgi:hypothetical protein
MTRFVGLEDAGKVLTRPQLIRPAYLKAMDAYLRQLRSGCQACRADHVLVDTGRPMGVVLAEYLARRLQVG